MLDENGNFQIEQIDTEYMGVKIGKGSYFGRGLEEGFKGGHIKSIGRFSSIASTAQIQENHPRNMISTAMLYEGFLDAEARKNGLIEPKNVTKALINLFKLK